MCYCTPRIKTPFCDSLECQTQLKIYLVDSDTSDEDRVFKVELDKLSNELSLAQAKLYRHKELCEHPKKYIKRVAGSNTGNWCADDDSYWYDCSCSLCGTTWTEDQ